MPDFARWPSFPFEGDLRVKQLDDPVAVEPPRKGEGTAECSSCAAPDDAYIWVSERWRVRAMDRPTGLPMVLILESRSHFDLGDLPNLLAAELGVLTVRLERAIRSLDGVARVHVNRWGDGSAHLHLWFLARPYGQLQLRGTFLSLWDSILPPISESRWRENLALVAAWLAEFGGRPLAEPPRIEWRAPSSLTEQASHPIDPDTNFDEDAPAVGPAASDGSVAVAVLPIENIEPAADLDELAAQALTARNGDAAGDPADVDADAPDAEDDETAPPTGGPDAQGSDDATTASETPVPTQSPATTAGAAAPAGSRTGSGPVDQGGK
ncbi:hypothetical protein O7623_20075 [Solwaraspora sp. WMMD791]|uniref:hypothetical protein n=1 Tax=Solwaraspora sp. WMMD791 TaxID=3016086 RepID=UPI00249C298C|nr:hypothetical protein [Solwaraspora sp. WMMD791]WFE30656.1 hypothetical protein O7623_20075 [Solwaraspora sp. WMMD791]